ncbi:dTMP kinase [Neptunomonas qingdaonensis]|uniref:Thymidylate kinase n=1 Tax=Neptunomonas qingdaonensis TaxID=1045558 RepID=A0A1I2PIR5_9GAMM|nr:dTMP kinase [Neptunomonas qingdaonensis]SFG13301.1 dTMP kinase [Neptunomonas qingdaonensis]
MDKVNKGCFITIEGTEGVGKSTNVEFIRQYLADKGIDLRLTREPGGTPLAEEIRELLLKPREEVVCDDAEILLVFAARAQHVDQVIKPTLEKGGWVLSDRFTDATFAYQGAGRGISWNRIQQLEQYVLGDLRPDLTILLDIPVEEGMARVMQRGEPDRFEREKLDFFDKVRQGYHHRLRAEPDRFALIDASQSLQGVQRQIAAALAEKLDIV